MLVLKKLTLLLSLKMAPPPFLAEFKYKLEDSILTFDLEKNKAPPLIVALFNLNYEDIIDASAY